jgi:hypothetical protein
MFKTIYLPRVGTLARWARERFGTIKIENKCMLAYSSGEKGNGLKSAHGSI